MKCWYWSRVTHCTLADADDKLEVMAVARVIMFYTIVKHINYFYGKPDCWSIAIKPRKP